MASPRWRRKLERRISEEVERRLQERREGGAETGSLAGGTEPASPEHRRPGRDS